MSVVARYGMKRTTMAELAQGAGVSRQTLYDRFGDKDGIMAATIRHLSAGPMAELGEAFASDAPLETKIDTFYQVAIWPAYDFIEQLPDAADFETGMGPASKEVIAEMAEGKRKLLAKMLTPHLPKDGQPPDQVAFFIERSIDGAKKSVSSRAALAEFMAVLKASILSLANT